MSASNYRIKANDMVHHIVSRIAHRVYFLGDEQRSDFLDIVRRTAEFCGLKLLAWCVMTNHFHLLVYLPERVVTDEEETLRRFAILRGKAAAEAMRGQFLQWRRSDASADLRIEKWLNAQRKRMYNIGEFMKTIKQWFTEDYNRREKHVGTLWESVYHSFPIPMAVKDMSRVAGYIHLNPIRAAACDRYDGYVWSSFTALTRGDPTALAGMRFIYDDEKASASALAQRHSLLLDGLLENMKRQRAEEICRKRAAGMAMPVDHLTSEAMVAQAAAHLAEVQNVLVSLHAERALAERKLQRMRDVTDERFLAAIQANPMADADELAEMLSIKPCTVYARLRKLRQKGCIIRNRRTDPWQVSIK